MILIPVISSPIFPNKVQQVQLVRPQPWAAHGYGVVFGLSVKRGCSSKCLRKAGASQAVPNTIKRALHVYHAKPLSLFSKSRLPKSEWAAMIIPWRITTPEARLRSSKVHERRLLLLVQCLGRGLQNAEHDPAAKNNKACNSNNSNSNNSNVIVIVTVTA